VGEGRLGGVRGRVDGHAGHMVSSEMMEDAEQIAALVSLFYGVFHLPLHAHFSLYAVADFRDRRRSGGF
jgi:hypothetical protein